MLLRALIMALLAALASPADAAQKPRGRRPAAASFQSFLVVEGKLPTDPNRALARLLVDFDVVHGPATGPPTHLELDQARPSHLSPAVSLTPLLRLAGGAVASLHSREPEAPAQRRQD